MAFSRMVRLLFKGESRQVFDFEKDMGDQAAGDVQPRENTRREDL
jgi:hypothetical protein